MNLHPKHLPNEFSHGKLYLRARRLVRQHFPWLIRPWTAFKRLTWLIRFPTAASRFTRIYETNYWASSESRSGEGSSLEATIDVRRALESFLADHHVQSMLDVPCGDFNWMRHVKMSATYVGGDVVPALISKNRDLHSTPRRAFEVVDLTRSNLPRCSFVFTRDCLNHLSIRDIFLALANIRLSGAEYLAVTQFPDHTVNCNQESGFHYRALNFRLSPFHWPPPLVSVREHSHPGKHITFWKIDSLPDFRR
jgi:hypothetical protein